MTNEKTNRGIMLFIILGMIALTAMVLTQVTEASAPSGLQATFATSSQVTVGPSKPNVASSTIPVFVSSTSCASRVITTYDYEIKLLFSNAMFSSTTANPSATYGHTQLASTTVVYDSGEWGCGYVNAYGFSSTTLTISEFR